MAGGKKQARVVDSRSGAEVSAPEEEAVPYQQNPDFIGRAFSLYCKGLSIERVCDALRPEWPGVASRTVARIAKLNGWEKSRAAYLKLHAEATASAEGLVPEMVISYQRLRNSLEGRIHALGAQDLFAYNQVCDQLLWLTGKHPKLKNEAPIALVGDKEISVFLRVIEKHKVIGPLLKKYRGEIRESVEEALGK
jgi:hypothetical protein